MAGNVQFKAQQFIDAIPGSGGIISTIAARVGCNWHTAKKYVTKYPTIKQAYDSECERVLDKAEVNVIGGIVADEPDIQLSKWYLTMKGRQRGYAKTERHELSVDVGGLTDEQLGRIVSGEDPLIVLAAEGERRDREAEAWELEGGEDSA